MVQLTQNQDGSCSITIRSNSGSILFKSIGYSSKIDAKTAFFNFREAMIFERRTNLDGKFVLDLKTKDGHIIGHSETYTSEAGMENGIKNMKKYSTGSIG